MLGINVHVQQKVLPKKSGGGVLILRRKLGLNVNLGVKIDDEREFRGQN